MLTQHCISILHRYPEVFSLIAMQSSALSYSVLQFTDIYYQANEMEQTAHPSREKIL